MTYERLLRLAKKMHLWIFLHCYDEEKVYEELGLTEEEDAFLGYGGSFTIEPKPKKHLRKGATKMAIKLKPCPFCGGEAELYSMKRDKRKRLGIYFMIAEIGCCGVLGCTARVSQAGCDEKRAFENAATIWNRRANDEQAD